MLQRLIGQQRIYWGRAMSEQSMVIAFDSAFMAVTLLLRWLPL
ncbi:MULTISPECIES: hypothetical protein [unclassified Pseudomonas]|jgi:hypothetical protein|nr:MULTISPECIES: hypothetical protein [unclassified Pseudomonas]